MRGFGLLGVFFAKRTKQKSDNPANRCAARLWSVHLFYQHMTKQKATAFAVAFCFGFRRLKGGSTLRHLNARGRQSRPSDKVFPCGENACTAGEHRLGPVGRVCSFARSYFQTNAALDGSSTQKGRLLRRRAFQSDSDARIRISSQASRSSMTSCRLSSLSISCLPPG